ncbi:MAG: SMP-30/gluconolactonase/LRE family protein [Frankiales bacterium]|nr:MAG: SMP-30/gluconolactonase/LRE family protein [Frankiales bacterium]
MRFLTDGLRFPEGPVMLKDGGVAVVELASGAITAVDQSGAKRQIAMTGGSPNGLAWGPDGMLYVCNNGGLNWIEKDGLLRAHGQADDYSGGRIERVDPDSGEVSRLYDRCGDHPLSGPNDIVFPPVGSPSDGGFWFTDIGKHRARDRNHGGVYWATIDGSTIIEVAFPVPGGANGIGLSPDGSTLYVAETDTARIWAWDVEGPGQLRKEPWPSPHGGRLLATLPGFTRLDSLAITAAGNIVVAALYSSTITTVSPAGEIVDVVPVPDAMPTNICFGGDDMSTAYITLSTTGRLLQMPWREPGEPLPYG